MTPVLALLRAGTDECHQRLERRLALLDEELSAARYAAVLVRFHAIWQGLEPRLAELLDDEAFWRPRRRLPWLDADLAGLGCATPALVGPPVLESLAAGLGALYVVEGSTLGGRVILRHLDRLGLRPATYFAGYGEATGRMWKGFLAKLQAVPESAAATAVAGATATFAHLEQHLCG